jgi:hypothetical protein
MGTRSPAHGVSVEGEVVEIFEQGGARWAKLVLKSPTVLDVLTPAARDVHLGDHVAVDGVLKVARIRSVPQGVTVPSSE